MPDLLVGIAPFIIGLGVVALLTCAVLLGLRKLRRSNGMSGPPGQHPGGADTTGHGPEVSGATGHERELREPDEVPRDGRRRLPHEMPGFGNSGTRRQQSGGRRRWESSTRGGGSKGGG
ncbi:DUF6479 family protein [Streptomyces sp. TRM 70351]|uniref:DUF6479 family protein n=1 Tax=Streptomyces sp. TRM 70351 TaxID=3116552 RepID=UPI002E7AC329|nr:DUF6479 family protein [Streptomyces sp. TRM 70351]MEE1929419.1 DUF6479 family protein [Streptomyces sp. TRM 70351]